MFCQPECIMMPLAGRILCVPANCQAIVARSFLISGIRRHLDLLTTRRGLVSRSHNGNILVEYNVSRYLRH